MNNRMIFAIFRNSNTEYAESEQSLTISIEKLTGFL